MVANFLLLLASSTGIQECPQDSALSFRRVYIALYEGPGNYEGNETTFAQTIGNCINPLDLATKMFEHFSKFDVDLTPMTQNPFAPYGNGSFAVLPRIGHPDSNFRVFFKSENSYADVVNSPIKIASWMLTTQIDLRGQQSLLPAGYISTFGMIT